MSWADRVPGMQPGISIWNLILLCFYLLLAFALIPVFIIILPAVAAIVVGIDYRNVPARLSVIPGIAAGGGVKSALVAFAVFSLVPLLVYSAGGATDNAPSSPSPAEATTSTQTAQPTMQPTETSTTTAPDTATNQNTPTARATASPTPSETPTETATPTATPTTDRTSEQVTVVEIVDGDTVDIRYPDGSRATARLLGVDTPEVHSETSPSEFEGVPDSSAGRSCLRDYGEQASSFTEEALLGETVQITFDENEGRTGYYGRLLIYIHTDDDFFNYQLIEEGYARVYDSQFEKRDQFYAAEDDAQSANRNVWSCRDVETATPTPVPHGGSSTADLRIAEIHADAAGNDHENLNDEYITIENTGESSVDLSGYTVRDTADHVYTVPSGTTLDAGAEITLYTGSGSDSETSLYWGQGSAVWNNGGDTIIIRDGSGSTVLEREYS